MSRRKPRSGGIGLFTWSPANGELQPGEVLTNPLDVDCPWPPCRAHAGHSCTTHRGRTRPPHPSRIDAATPTNHTD